MLQFNARRLLVMPAIVLTAVLLTGCAMLPGGGAPSTSSSNRDDADEKADTENTEGDDAAEAGGCPQSLFDGMTAASGRSDGVSNFTITELTPDEFQPAGISDVLEGGCLYSMGFEKDGTSTTVYQAYIPGGDDVRAQLEADLVAAGFSGSPMGHYANLDLFVTISSSDDMGLTAADLKGMELDFLGDEFLFLVAYTG